MKSLGILAADDAFKAADFLAPVRPCYHIQDFGSWRTMTADALVDACRSVDVLITGRRSPRLPDLLAQGFGRLRYLCHLHGTVKHLVSKLLIEAGLIVTNWGDTTSNVAEGAMALLLCLLKQLPALDHWTRGGEDRRIYQNYPTTLNGVNVGLYGYGPIGRHMGRMLEPFGANIAIFDPFAGNVPAGMRVCGSLRELFATCAIISIHCGLNDQTRNSVTGELLALLPQGGVVINTARGPIVDEAALAAEVAAGRLLAGLDVIADEGAWTHCAFTPLTGAMLSRHHVSNTAHYQPGHAPPPKLPAHAVDNLLAYAHGRPLKHLLTADIYDSKT